MAIPPLPLYQILNKYVEGTPSNPVQAVDKAFQDGSVRPFPEDIAVLVFAKLLLQFGDNDWATCVWLIKQMHMPRQDGGGRTPTLSESLASLLFPSSQFDELKKQSPPNPNVLGRLRVGFFEADPLVALKTIVLDNTGKFSLRPEVRELALRIMDAAIDTGSDLDSPEVINVAKSGAKRGSDLQADFDAAVVFVMTVRNLSRVARDPEEVSRLYSRRLRTIHEIATTRKDRLAGRLGMPQQAAAAIRSAAQRIDCWNEQFWLDLMNERRQDFIPVEPEQKPNKKDPDTADDDKREKTVRSNNLTDIFQLEDAACETCCSITSLSAYLADLLSLLKRTRSAESDITTLFEILDKRRPDLKHLKLSCANSQTLIPYISLVNEVLESYIDYQSRLASSGNPDQQEAIRAWNTPEDVEPSAEDEGELHSDQPVYRPGNTIDSVYSAVISKQMYPFTHFPYAKPCDEIAQILGAFKVHMPELEVFRLRQHLLDTISKEKQKRPELRSQLKRGVDEVFARQSAAEALGVQQAEFSAVTGETFFPSWFTDLLHGLSENDKPSPFRSAPPWTAAGLWGYPSADEMVKETSGTRLSLIKAELMKRSGLEFQDVLELARSQCFSQDLVIVNKDGSREFLNSLEDLLLLASSSEPPFKDLTEEICFNLQAFLRLRERLKWTTRDLDAAIFSLRSHEMQKSPHASRPQATSFFSISPYVVKGISSVVKLSQLTGVGPAAVLPLWGTMDAYGDKSFLYRRFLTSALQRVSPIFKPPPHKSDMFLTVDGSRVLLRDEDSAICMALGWPVECYEPLLRVVGRQGNNQSLDVDSFSVLYRHVLVCRMLQVSPKDCQSFFEMFFAGPGDPLENPAATLSAVTKWKSLLVDAGWTVRSLHNALLSAPDPGRDGAIDGGGDDNQGTSARDGLRIIPAIAQGVRGIRNSFPFLFADSAPTSAQVAECASRVFDAATAKVVVDFVEGTQVESITARFASPAELNAAIATSRSWPRKLRLAPDLARGAPQAELSIAGTLSAEEDKAISNLSAQPASLKQAIETLRNQARAAGDIIRRRFKKAAETNAADLVKIILGEKLPSAVPDWSAAAEDEKDAVQDEFFKRERQRAFVKLSSPTIVRELTDALTVNTVQAVVPDLNTNLIPFILSDIVWLTAKSEGEKESALMALQRLNEPQNAAALERKLDAYFTPNATDVFALSYTNDGNPATLPNSPSLNLTVNGVIIDFHQATSTWEPLRMVSGQTYRLVGNFKQPQLLWSTPKSMASPFTEQMLLPVQMVQTANQIMAAVRRVAAICRTHRLTVEELEHFGIPKTAIQRVLAIDFNAPTVDLLAKLQDYVGFRDKCKPTADKDSSMSLLLCLSRTTALTKDVIVSELAACTGWNRNRLLDAVTIKYEGCTVAELLASLRDVDELLALQAIMSIDDRLALAAGVDSQPSMYELFSIAKSRYTPTLNDDAMAAGSLRARLSPSQRALAERGLAENQRRALVAYLLQQDYIKKLGIYNADDLFEYFLIDVQMGPQLRTSRVKQAISVVQLFAQRTLLGLEKGVSKAALDRDQWQWRQQYSLWEAYMKIFLYPENWLEPTLRDDKSQLFDEFEASLMKKNLSLDTFTDAIKTYVYGLNQIAGLEMVAYVRDSSRGSVDVFHLFGRTRASPHTFYHRTLTILRSGTVGRFWRPWAKVDMDIPSTETEWEGKRLDITGSHLIPVLAGARLYLFMPQITPKSAQKDGATAYEEKSFGDLAREKANTAKPKRFWEITMAWTELSRGTWTPKRVATGSLTLESALTPPNSLRFEPKFEAEKSKTKVTLVAGYLGQNNPGQSIYTKFGAFSFCEDQMVSIPDPRATFDLSAPLFPSTFQQESLSGQFEDGKSPLTDGENDKSFLWVPKTLIQLDRAAPVSRKTELISWTLSYSREEGPTSLVLSTRRKDGTNINYFNTPKKEYGRLRSWPSADLDQEMDLETMDHTFSHTLMGAAASPGDALRNVFDILTNQKHDELPGTFGGMVRSVGADKTLPMSYHELARPASLFNWEIGLHSVLLAMDRFFATQQFEEALQVARLVFDPTTETKTASCWRFPPFQDIARQISRKRGTNLKVADIAKDKDFNLAIMERRTQGALVHATARGRPESYMKWVVMKYAEILIAAGDVHFRRGTLESLPLAIQRYAEASHILGPEPPKIPKLGKRKPSTFDQLHNEDVRLELGLPFSPRMRRAEMGDEDELRADEVVCYLRTTYFCVPLNPKFKQMRSLVNERLFNIRNSLDIQGRPVTYTLIEPPIDPAALIALGSQGLNMSNASAAVLGDQASPLPRQRFEVLLRQATELCGELRGLGERLLSAVEKKEGERFVALRARHATAIQNRMVDIKKTNLNEAEQTIQSLQISRDSQVSQLAFYLSLAGEPESMIPQTAKDRWVDIRQDIDAPTKDDLRMSSYEKIEMDSTNVAGTLNLIAAGIDKIAAPLYALPQVDVNGQPMGIGVSVGVGGSNLGAAVAAGSSSFKMQAMMASEEAGRAARKAQLARQLQERRLQANMRGREIKIIDKQIEIQQIRVQALRKEMELHQAEVEEAMQVESWYRTKYSSEQLYGWMEKALRNLYYQAYTLAVSTARKAERALSFEKGYRVTLLRQDGYYWDAARDGLLSADHLWLDLKRLEAAHLDAPHHDYEITKTVSLRQINPLALMRLRLTGTTGVFSLGESLFDADFPGHYMRRIRSVAVSIPAVVGPYSGINATLRLMGHCYRISSTAGASKADEYAAQDRAAFRTDNVPISAVAISSGTHDAGVFELDFSGATYQPFEGAGAVSSWRLDLPDVVRQFDYEAISDVLLHVHYTTLDGGVMLRSVANEAVRMAAKARQDRGRDEGFWALWDLKNDFVDAWCDFASKLGGAAGGGGERPGDNGGSGAGSTAGLKLGNLKERLPYWSRQQPKYKVHDIIWASESSKLVEALGVSGVSAPGHDDKKVSSFGRCTVKTWSNLNTVTSLEGSQGWELTVPAKVLGDETVPNVYMLMRYTFD
ncbi:hypothetical protein F5B21DRAFT_522016 [Xylaria acuta]|nr:hypothetical protein F5B21DRAFT_522016 [Xylaria acuta]